MDFSQICDGTVISGMTIDDLPADARIFVLSDSNPFHLMVSTGNRSWEYRVNGTLDGRHHWQTWRSNSLAWATSHGQEITREHARILISTNGPVYEPHLQLQEGL